MYIEKEGERILKELFIKVRQFLAEKNLGESIRQLKRMLEKHRNGIMAERLDVIANDHQLMLDYMLRGFKDEKREELYDKLLKKTERLANDWEHDLRLKNVPAYSELLHRQLEANTSLDSVRHELEAFVAETALLGLDHETYDTDKERNLYLSHHQYMEKLFNTLWLAPQWDEPEANFYKQLLLSPSIDVNDAKWMVAAIMLSCMNLFDIYKFETLIHVYNHAIDEALRQRALVGWVFSLQNMPKKREDAAKTIKELCDKEEVCRELLEFQMQIYLCLNAERDNEEIRKDIMPNLMKNNRFSITRFGITEKEEDEMQDILNPGAADKAMEEMEESVRRMMDMQKSGSDIYFGGFSHMKNYPFFFHLCNWFVPFSLKHPDLARVTGEKKHVTFIKQLFQFSPFCDNDKYSFVLAMATFIDKIPADMMEMMGNPEATMGAAISQEEQESGAYIRRMYLQDLYRFFRLYKNRYDFASPFPLSKDEKGHELFFVHETLVSTLLSKEAEELGRFLLKQKHFDSLQLLLDSYVTEENGNTMELIRATLAMQNCHFEEAILHYLKVTEVEPDNLTALSGLSKCYFYNENFDKASILYKHLMDIKPEKKGYALNYAFCLIKQHQADEAVQLLYKLNYEYPEDISIARVLAWGLLVAKKVEQSCGVYDKILSSSKVNAEDRLNAGYARWFSGAIAESVGLFKEFVMESGSNQEVREQIENEFGKDKDLLDIYQISNIERNLLTDLIIYNG